MNRPSFARLGSVVFLVWLCLAFNALQMAAADAKRVLILHPFAHDVAPFSDVISAFRGALVRELGETVVFHEVPLDLAQFGGDGAEEALVDFIANRLRSQPVDLVVPVGGASLGFVARHRERLFAGLPLVIVAAEPRMVPPGLLEANATLVTQQIHLPGMVEDILQMQPETENIVVVFGASALERFWAAACRREFQQFEDRVRFTWVDDLSLDQIVEKCSTLPARSFILHGLFLVDAKGISCENNEALRRLHERANAPVFSYFASELGRGGTGGRLFRDTEVGAAGARAAVRVLRGEPAGSLAPHVLEAGAPSYDWRELRRWGISEANLAAEADIQFRDPGFWRRYRAWITAAIGFFLVQVALIVGLWVNRSRWKHSEAEAALVADISSRFVNLKPEEVDGEILDAQRRICGFFGLDFSTLWQVSADEPGSFRLTHFHDVQGGPQPPEKMNQDDYPWARQELVAGRVVRVESVDTLPPQAARDAETLRRFGIRSNLALPLVGSGGVPLGLLGLGTMRRERAWPDGPVRRLEMIATVFANALARKQADRSLHDSEERLTLAAESAEAGLWSLDCRTREFWVTAKARLIFGYSSDEVVTWARFMAALHPDDIPLVEGSIDHSLRSGDAINVEYRIRLADGSERSVVSRGRPFFTPAGQPERVQGLSMDITERKRIEKALRDSEARLAAGTELAGLAHHEIDYAKQTCFMDEPMFAICGIRPGHHADLQPIAFWFEHIHPDDQPLVRSEREKLHAREVDRISVEYRYLHPAGGIRWIHHLARAAASDASGRPIRTYGALRDITSLKNSELEARELRSKLMHADRVTLLGQLASALAHELSQPLGAILRNAEAAELLLQESSPDLEELRAIVTDIHQDDRRAGLVIDRLRSLLKRRSLDLQPIEIRGVIEDVLALVRGDAAARHIAPTFSADPNLPVVRGDRIHLQQVLLNLIVNAMDALGHCEPGQGHIEVSARQLPSDMLEVRVSDNGPGLPSEVFDHLFEPFFTTKTKGMGIGLPVCKTIIEMHRGTLRAENRPEGGASFIFTVPVGGVGMGAQGQALAAAF